MQSPGLVEYLEGLSPDALTEILVARPELLDGYGVENVRRLAEVLSAPYLQERAMYRLTEFDDVVMRAITIASVDGPVSLVRVHKSLQPHATKEQVAASVQRLRVLGFAYGTNGRLQVTEAVRAGLGKYPDGLGDPYPGKNGPKLPQALAGLGEVELEILMQFAIGGPMGRVGLELAGLVAGLVARKVLLRVNADMLMIPREVALLLRGDWPMRKFRATAPEAELEPVDQPGVDHAGMTQAREIVRSANMLIDFIDSEPLPVNKSGALSLPDLRKAMRKLGLQEALTVLLLEIFLAGGMIANDLAQIPQFRTAVGTTRWYHMSFTQQWLFLVKTWLTMNRVPWASNSGLASQKRISPLSPAMETLNAREERRYALAPFFELPTGKGFSSIADVADIREWQSPKFPAEHIEEWLLFTLAESMLLGLFTEGVPCTAARRLWSQAKDEDVLAALPMPDTVDYFLLQPDLTVTSLGLLAPKIAQELALCADVESQDVASVYRITADTVRRAIAGGRTAARIREFLTEHSRTPMPQSLTYLIEDSGRTANQIQGGSAASYLVVSDSVVLAGILSATKKTNLNLCEVAPTVVVSDQDLVSTTAQLAKVGFVVTTAHDAVSVTEKPRIPYVAGQLYPNDDAIVPKQLAKKILAADPDFHGMSYYFERDEDKLEIIRSAISQNMVVRLTTVNGRDIQQLLAFTPQKITKTAVSGYNHYTNKQAQIKLDYITQIHEMISR